MKMKERRGGIEDGEKRKTGKRRLNKGERCIRVLQRRFRLVMEQSMRMGTEHSSQDPVYSCSNRKSRLRVPPP